MNEFNKKLLRIILFSLCFFAFVNQSTAESNSQIPSPQMVFDGTRDYDNGQYHLTTYWLNVVNRSEFPEEMFEPAPDLPPCGKNVNSSRSWIDVFDASHRRLYGFCGIKTTSELNKLSFTMQREQNPPEYVYIVITDRKTKRKFSSNLVPIRNAVK